MNPALLLPVVGVAFGLGMVVNRLHSSQDLGVGGRAPALSPEATSPIVEIGSANEGELTLAELLVWNLSTLSGKVALYQRLWRLDSTSLKALAEGFESYPYDLQRREVSQQIFAAWAEIDPDAACEFAKTVGNPQAKQDFYRALLAVLVDEDLAKARAVLAEIKDPQVRLAAVQSLASSALVESDPDMVLELLAEWGDHESRHYVAVFQAWAAKDLVAAGKAFARVNLRAQPNAAAGIARAWAHQDSGAAFEWANQLSNRQARKTAVSEVFRFVVDQDVEQALVYWEALSGGAVKQRALQTIASTYFGTDVEAATAWIERLSARERREVLPIALSVLASTTPNLAVKLFEEAPMQGSLGGGVSMIAMGLAEEDPGKAVAWVETLPIGTMRNRAISGLVETWGKMDPEAATVYLHQYGLGDENTYLAATVLMRWLAQDRDAALRWVRALKRDRVERNVVRDMIGRWTKQDPLAVAEFVGSLEDVELRRSATSSMVTSLSRSDPFAALAFIRSQDSDEKGDQVANLLLSTASNDYQTAIQIYEDYLPPPSERDINGKFSSALISMVTSWGRHDPEAAANWALSFPDGDTRNNAVANLARAWVKEDASVVSEWISKLPKGPARDHAILPLISAIKHGDPEAAFTWAFAVSEKRKRHGALLTVVRPWMKKDPGAAAFAVESADLPQGMVADLLLNR